MTKVTKTQVTIRVMTENADKPMAEVVGLIAEANGVTEAVARGAYRWVINKNLAPGKIESSRSKSKEVPAKKMLKELNIHAPSNRLIAAAIKKDPTIAQAKVEKTADEIAQIKAANLERMKEVTRKMSKMRHAVDGPGVENFDADEARREVAETDDLESFAVPKFLTKSQVKVLV